MKYKIQIIIGLIVLCVFGALYVAKQLSNHAQAPVVAQDLKEAMLFEVAENKVTEIEALVFDTPVAFDNSNELVVGNDAEFRVSGFEKVDLIHKGSGDVVISKTKQGALMTFKNFAVTPGPDLFVYLSKERPQEQGDDLGEFVNLGPLQSNKGDQSYALPQNYEEYGSVVIWCRAFGVLFSYAPLR
ncbi:DM13 domain-containing protein [Candidatus Falkowbacteria bacterium]|nr:DM13 domain-containing protein [Candidatus Falkowbacteria bacterium]